MACPANEFRMTKAEICALSNKEYKRGPKLMLHPDHNFGCPKEATEKFKTLETYRSECEPREPEARPEAREPEPKVQSTALVLHKTAKADSPKKASPKKSPTKKLSPYRLAKANDQVKAFRTRNHVTWDRDIYGNIVRKGLYDPTVNILGDVRQAAVGLGNTALGIAKIGKDVIKGAYYGVTGVANGALGIGRAGHQTLRYGQKSWARMRFNQAKQRLRNCTTECNSIEDCCTKEEIRRIHEDIDERYAAIRKEEREKRDHLLQEAESYAKINLPPEDAKAFYDLAVEQIEQEYNKAMHELADKKGGRSRRRR
jgi:hypothetical protein